MRPKPLIKLSSELLTGIHPGMLYDSVPLWQDGHDVSFRRGSIRPITAQQLLLARPESSPITGMAQYCIGCPILGDRHVVFFGTANNIYSWEKNFGVVNRSKVGGYTGGIWHFTQWGSWVIATNGVDPPQLIKYLEDADFSNLDTENVAGRTFDTAQIITTYRNFAIALNTRNNHVSAITGGPTFIHFSNLDDVETWDPIQPSGIGSAGDLPVRGADSPIRAAILYRNTLFFFTENTGNTLNFLGAPLFFGLQLVLDRAGAVGKHAVTRMGNFLYGMSKDFIWRSDGNQVQVIDEPSIHRYIYDRLDREKMLGVVAWANHRDQIVEFHFPIIGTVGNSKAVGFSVETGVWSPLTKVRSAAVNFETSPYGITGTGRGNILRQVTSDVDSPLTAGESLMTPFTFEEELIYVLFGFGYLGFGQGGFGGVIAGNLTTVALIEANP